MILIIIAVLMMVTSSFVLGNKLGNGYNWHTRGGLVDCVTRLSLKGKNQGPLIMIIREDRDIEGKMIFAKVLWSSNKPFKIYK